jgi:hypothetical protein
MKNEASQRVLAVDSNNGTLNMVENDLQLNGVVKPSFLD